MLINRGNLDIAFNGFKTLFNDAFAGAPTAYKEIASVVPSSSAEETYGWLGQIQSFREWIGPRVVVNLSAHSYRIRNRDFENTVSVGRNDFEDDKYGIFAPAFSEMGRAAAEFPDQLVFDLLVAGFATECYDEQYFFDTDHPVRLNGPDSPPTSVSNTGGGSGSPWFLLDTSRMVKPLIFQERRALGTLVSKDRPEDDNVFSNKEYLYGSDGRCNVGFGLWQLAYGSKDTLNAANYAAARAALMGMRGDGGRPLGVRPTTLVVGPALEQAALKLLNSEFAAGGETNEWKGTAKLIVTPYIASA